MVRIITVIAASIGISACSNFTTLSSPEMAASLSDDVLCRPLTQSEATKPLS